jgi:hypothetical protein
MFFNRRLQFFFLFISLFLTNAGAAEWEPVYEKEGIKVWEKYIEGSSVVAFRGQVIVETNIHQAFSILYDADHKKDFLQNCIDYRILKVKLPGQTTSYVKIGNNFPFIDDRDIVIESKVELLPSEKKIVVYVWKSSDELFPPTDDAVRVPKMKGHWSFQALGQGKTKIFYQMESDPGGLIPKWIVNMANKGLPFKTLTKLRNLSKQKETFAKTATMIKYFFDFRPFLGKDHPASQRNKKEAKVVEDNIKLAFKEACDAGDKVSCKTSREFKLKDLQ